MASIWKISIYISDTCGQTEIAKRQEAHVGEINLTFHEFVNNFFNCPDVVLISWWLHLVNLILFKVFLSHFLSKTSCRTVLNLVNFLNHDEKAKKFNYGWDTAAQFFPICGLSLHQVHYIILFGKFQNLYRGWFASFKPEVVILLHKQNRELIINEKSTQNIDQCIKLKKTSYFEYYSELHKKIIVSTLNTLQHFHLFYWGNNDKLFDDIM